MKETRRGNIDCYGFVYGNIAILLRTGGIWYVFNIMLACMCIYIAEIWDC